LSALTTVRDAARFFDAGLRRAVAVIKHPRGIASVTTGAT
jgi:hypothetical protein